MIRPAKVGQGVLKSQGDGQAGHAQKGDDGGELHTHGPQEHQGQQQPQHDGQGGAEVPVDGGQGGVSG